MKKKVLTAAALVTAIAASLMGCSSSDKQNTDGVKSIRFASWDNSKDLDEQQKLVDKFNEAHKDIKVTLEAYGSDFDTKIAAGMYSSKNWMFNIWSWDNCFSALPLSDKQPELAYSQLKVFYGIQDASGCYPDYVNDKFYSYSCCKPPIHACSCPSHFPP